MKHLTLLYCSFFLTLGCAQTKDLTGSLYDSYETYKEPTLDNRRIKYVDLQPLIASFQENPKFDVAKVGESIEGRDLWLISVGSGETDVFLWSQMHGNEPTATQAIFDILNFLNSDDYKEEKREILNTLRVHFLPMLNPDGAEVYQRRNTLGIDINRDALRLQSPEGQTLKRVRDSVEADFGFNLHDQSTYYNAERTEKPATISYLAPPFNYEKEINESRGNAMRIIVFMNDIIQKYAPGQVGRYSDDFEPRAFGDNIQKWGTSTILIESGGFPEDPEKQEIRKLNYVSILSAIYTIAKENYKEIALERYEEIPKNDRKLFDLKIVGVKYPLLGRDYVLDLGIQRFEVDKEGHNEFWHSSRIMDQGDLSTYYGYETLDATGLTIREAKVHPKQYSLKEIVNLDPLKLLKEGYGYIRVSDIPREQINAPIPLHWISSEFEVPELRLEVGQNPTFLLQQGNDIRYAVINGFLIDLDTGAGKFSNAMIYR